MIGSPAAPWTVRCSSVPPSASQRHHRRQAPEVSVVIIPHVTTGHAGHDQCAHPRRDRRELEAPGSPSSSVSAEHLDLLANVGIFDALRHENHLIDSLDGSDRTCSSHGNLPARTATAPEGSGDDLPARLMSARSGSMVASPKILRPSVSPRRGRHPCGFRDVNDPVGRRLDIGTLCSRHDRWGR